MRHLQINLNHSIMRIKLLQFRKLYRHDDENVEEWMERLSVAAVECNYHEVNRQLKELFVYGLNDKCMLEEIIKELTATKMMTV